MVVGYLVAENSCGFAAQISFRIDMCSTCKYAVRMSKMVQIRNMPDHLHRTLKARAAMAGMSLSDYLLKELREVAALPTLAEFQQRLARRKPVKLPGSVADIIREERDNR